jgi:biotin carboxyl carrier protein
MVKYEVTVAGKRYEVEIIRDDGRHALLRVDGREYEVDASSVSTGSAPAASVSPAGVTPAPEPKSLAAATAAPAAEQEAAMSGDVQLRAPMPGLVLEVCVSVGQGVKRGDVLLRLEAMKMENDIESHTEGKIKQILIAKGDEVQESELLMVLEG